MLTTVILNAWSWRKINNAVTPTSELSYTILFLILAILWDGLLHFESISCTIFDILFFALLKMSPFVLSLPQLCYRLCILLLQQYFHVLPSAHLKLLHKKIIQIICCSGPLASCKQMRQTLESAWWHNLEIAMNWNKCASTNA